MDILYSCPTIQNYMKSHEQINIKGKILVLDCIIKYG